MHRNDQMMDLSRAVAKLAADMTSTLIVDAERMCLLQAQFVRDACREQAKAAELLKAAASPQDMLAIQIALVSGQVERAVSCWTDFCASADANPMETFGPAQMRTLLACWSACGGFSLPASTTTD